jgi:iron complex outermembrane receptor protein
MHRPIAYLSLVLVVGAGLTKPSHAQQQPVADTEATLPDVRVIDSTPLLGSLIDPSEVPATTRVLTPADIDRTNVPSLTGAILDNIPSATVNDVSGNSFQPDILFRGFTASPVAGTAQGLAVYVNGVRFNDPFGDTVNWDLIPSIAIDTVNVEASNPVFGLNALGGSVNVGMKNGFTYDGADATLYGGSYDRGAGILQYVCMAVTNQAIGAPAYC